jgi:hypothetical protein
VIVSSGSVTWSGNIPISGKDLTIIASTKYGPTIAGWGFALNNSASRMSGFTFNHTGSYMLFDGSQGWRFDNNIVTRTTWDFTFLVVGSLNGTASNTPSEGLFDHNQFTNCRIVMYGEYNDTGGQNRYSEVLNLGTVHNVYIEDNTFTSTQSCISSGAACNAVDDNAGGRYVARFNTINGAYFEAHSGSNYLRGNRLVEIYNNTMTPPSAWRRPLYLAAGTGMVFNNHLTSAYGENYIDLYNLRTCESQPSPFYQCDGSRYVDGNQDSSGYPCRDQIGTSTDASKWNANFTNPAPSQAFAPAYIWGNYSGSSTIVPAVVTTPGTCDATETTKMNQQIVENRNFFNGTDNFNGTSGIGTGALNSRPATCTVGVGYWATDQGSWNQSGNGGQGVLYQCTATNTWTVYYTPYTYPHPLAGGGESPPVVPVIIGVTIIGGQVK